jgi:lysophospholipase L1-like esterase
MQDSRWLHVLRRCFLFCFLLLVPRLAPAQQNGQQNGWVATWGTSPEPAEKDGKDPLLNLEDQTVRQRVRVSIGGPLIRIRLSNEYASSPLLIDALTVAKPVDVASVQASSLRRVTFGGKNSVEIPSRAAALSDPVPFAVTDCEELSISIHFPKRVVAPTMHALALKRAVISERGNYAETERIEAGTVSRLSILVTAVMVPAQPRQRVVVTFGDSVTDGDGSTPEMDHNWPSELARRLAKAGEGRKVAIVNEGIAGNRLLSDGTAIVATFGESGETRFERDALGIPGVTHVVLLEGTNDIGFPGAKLGELSLADAREAKRSADLIRAYRELIARAHARGVKLIGATMAPFEGVDIRGYYSEAKEATRQAVNQWIRSSGVFDGVIDFDAVLRDRAHPSRMAARFASEDHLHPNDAGYHAMADAVDLRLLQ